MMKLDVITLLFHMGNKEHKKPEGKRYYICKIFTAAFKQVLDIEISREIDKMLNEAHIPNEHRHLHVDLLYKQRMQQFRNMWVEPAHYEIKFPESAEFYKSIGLWQPQFDILHLEAKETEFQTQARVEWNGEVLRIDDIEEIYSYTVDYVKPHRLQEALMHHRV